MNRIAFAPHIKPGLDPAIQRRDLYDGLLAFLQLQLIDLQGYAIAVLIVWFVAPVANRNHRVGTYKQWQTQKIMQLLYPAWTFDNATVQQVYPFPRRHVIIHD